MPDVSSVSRRPVASTRTAAASPFAPMYGAAAEKELGAIADFLKRNWEVKALRADVRPPLEALVKKNGLDAARFRELAAPRGKETRERLFTRAVFAYGVLAGERYAMSQRSVEIDMVNLLRKSQGKPPLPGLKKVEPLNFGTALDAVSRVLAKSGAKAEPSGWAAYKKTADEYDVPGPESETFKGRELHPSLGATVGGFGVSMSRATTFYNFVRDRSPLNTFASSVFRQGMSLGVATVEKPIQAAIDRARADAGLPSR